MRLNLDKPGIRALGVAESFRPRSERSVLAGVVMRSDFIIDGAAFSRTRVGGDDATAAIAALHRRFRRNDINLVMVSGAILSLYNIIDVDELSKRTGVPVVCVTYKETSGIEETIRRRFPASAEKKLRAYRKLGRRVGVPLRTGHRVYVRASGLERGQTRQVLDAFTLQGSVPEPLKVARLLARAALAGASPRG